LKKRKDNLALHRPYPSPKHRRKKQVYNVREPQDLSFEESSNLTHQSHYQGGSSVDIVFVAAKYD